MQRCGKIGAEMWQDLGSESEPSGWAHNMEEKQREYSELVMSFQLEL